MDAPRPWPVPVASVGPVAVGTTLWRHLGLLRVTVTVKATFRLAHNHTMRVAAPEPLHVVDQYSAGAPPSSLSAIRETAPKLSHAEVLLFGHAYPPRSGDGGQRAPARETTTRLRVGQQKFTWIDKSVRVVGDRGDREPSTAFERMPICYERALGAPTSPDNPLGVGLEGYGARVPNLLSPDEPFRAVACYGPVPSFFPSRERLRGNHGSAAMDEGLVEMADDFDWEYFHAAPADQRLHRLRAGDWLVLTHLSPFHDTLRAVLPQARAVTTVIDHAAARAPSAAQMEPDQLILRPDEGKCSIVWRGSLPVSSRAACQEMIVVGALETDAKPVRWPKSRAEAVSLAAPPPASTGDRMATGFDDSPTLWRPHSAKSASAEPAGSSVMDGDGDMPTVVGRQAADQLGDPADLARTVALPDRCAEPGDPADLARTVALPDRSARRTAIRPAAPALDAGSDGNAPDDLARTLPFDRTKRKSSSTRPDSELDEHRTAEEDDSEGHRR